MQVKWTSGGKDTNKKLDINYKRSLSFFMAILPPLAAIRVFEAAARHENFTVAAQELGMTQAAVSYQIKLLEERLGFSLFQRSGRRMALTDRGKVLAPSIISAFDLMRESFANLASENEAVLTISCTNSFATNWLVPRLGSFQMLRPELAVRLKASDAVLDLAREGVDVGVRNGFGQWSGLESREFFHCRIAPMCSPEFLEKSGPIDSVAKIMELPRISPHDLWWSVWWERMGDDRQLAYDGPVIRLDSQVMDGRAAMAGQGLAMLIPYYWRDEIAAGRLVEPVRTACFDPSRHWLVYPPHARTSRKMKAFRDWIEAEVRKDAAEDEMDVIRLPGVSSLSPSTDTAAIPIGDE